jgi:hypothetical protein
LTRGGVSAILLRGLKAIDSPSGGTRSFEGSTSYSACVYGGDSFKWGEGEYPLSSESHSCARHVQDKALRQGRHDLLDRFPPGAVRGDDVAGVDLPELLDRPADDGLEDRAVEVEAGHDHVNGFDTRRLAGIPDCIDDPEVRATGQDNRDRLMEIVTVPFTNRLLP